MARILVVDDDPVMQMTNQALSRTGRVQCRGRRRRPQGPRSIQDGHFDRVLLDIFIPTMDGLEA